MAAPRPRHDRYGRPLPTVAPVERRSLVDSDQNRTARQRLVWLLEHEYAELFRAGVWGEVVLTFAICDGTIQADLHVEVKRSHRQESEER